jgi:hypothetical protein
MKTKFLILLFIFPIMIWAQEDTKAKIKKLSEEIEQEVQMEKEKLKALIKEIELDLETGKITEKEAGERKRESAEAKAEDIEKIIEAKVAEIERLTQQIVEESLSNTIEIDTTDTKEKKVKKIVIEFPKVQDHHHKKTKELKSTHNRIVFAFGLNNIITDGKINTLDDSPYEVWNSNFVDLGWGYKTAFNKENPFIRLDYGLLIQWKELKLLDNLYHESVDEQTIIVEHVESLKKSKLRTTQLLLPVYLEFDFGRSKTVDDRIIKKSGVKLGLGGYAGLRLNTKQIIKYNAPRDSKKDKISDDYNMNNITYGLSGYLGYKDTSLYIKYDLHPLFKNTETSNVSIGVKMDL